MIDLNEELTTKIEKCCFSASQDAKSHLFYPVFLAQLNTSEKYRFSIKDEEDFFLIFTVKGKLNLELDDEEYELCSNYLTITNAKNIRCCTLEKNSSELLILQFNGNGTEHILSLINKYSSKIIFPVNPKTIKKNIKVLMTSIKGKKILTEAQMSLKIYEILCECIILYNKDIRKNSVFENDYDTIVSLAEEFIINNLSSPLNVKTIAKHINMSPSHFSKIFKAQTGCSPYEYVLDLRLNKAKEYLIKSDKSIEQIAELCGFNSESNFVYFFKKSTGLSPLKYRKQGNKENYNI